VEAVPLFGFKQMNSATTSLLADDQDELDVLSFGDDKAEGTVATLQLKVEGEPSSQTLA